MITPEISIIAHDIRSTHNVGALLRMADGLGVHCVYLTGYTPYPLTKNDTRLPHESRKITNQIHKTSLGTEHTTSWQHEPDVHSLIHDLSANKVVVFGLEQSNDSVQLDAFTPPSKLCILLGSEIDGIDDGLITMCDEIIEIPMFGEKESHNVITAAAIAVGHCRFTYKNV
jgi:23S rRNA (guanosine2251-2'-O)-methyltransferase